VSVYKLPMFSMSPREERADSAKLSISYIR
jgi:hypothetical protein